MFKQTQLGQPEELEIKSAIIDAYQKIFQQEDSNLSVLAKFKCIQQKQEEDNIQLNNQIEQYIKKIARLEAILYFKDQSQQKQPEERILIPRTSPKQSIPKAEPSSDVMIQKKLFQNKQIEETIKKLERQLRVKQKQLEIKNKQVVSLKTKFMSKFEDIQSSVVLKTEKQGLLMKQKQYQKQIQELKQHIKQYDQKELNLKKQLAKKQEQLQELSQKNKITEEKLQETTKLYLQACNKLKSRQEEMQKSLAELRNQLVKKTKQQLTNYFKQKEKMKEQFNAKLTEKDKLINKIVTQIEKTTRYRKKTTQPLESWLENAKKYLNQNIKVGQGQDQFTIQKRDMQNRRKMIEEEW